MAVGDRIKRIRNFRKMTMKELGMAVGFDENSADVRIAQYENNSRKPKEELLRKIAGSPSMPLVATTATKDAAVPPKRIAICFDYNLLNDFMTEWMLRKQQMRSGEITREEYQEWKLNWPQTADDCGKFEPKKVWRKSK